VVRPSGGGGVWSGSGGARVGFSNPRRLKAESGCDILGFYPHAKRAAAKTFPRDAVKYSRLCPSHRQIQKTSARLGAASPAWAPLPRPLPCLGARACFRAAYRREQSARPPLRTYAR
jgi:hypothetical protein